MMIPWWFWMEPVEPIEIHSQLRLAVMISSGKHTKNDGKSPFFMGKSTVTCNFQIAFCMFTRG